jgi:hypothetical protein
MCGAFCRNAKIALSPDGRAPHRDFSKVQRASIMREEMRQRDHDCCQAKHCCLNKPKDIPLHHLHYRDWTTRIPGVKNCLFVLAVYDERSFTASKACTHHLTNAFAARFDMTCAATVLCRAIQGGRRLRMLDSKCKLSPSQETQDGNRDVDIRTSRESRGLPAGETPKMRPLSSIMNQSVLRAFVILNSFRSPDEWVLGCEISRRSSIREGTVYRFLHSLEKVGAVIQDEEGRYRCVIATMKKSEVSGLSERIAESCPSSAGDWG